MAVEGTWAKDGELLTAANFLKTDIMLWLPKREWALFSRNMLNKGNNAIPSRKTIYLRHTNSNHFDFIKDIE